MEILWLSLWNGFHIYLDLKFAETFTFELEKTKWKLSWSKIKNLHLRKISVNLFLVKNDGWKRKKMWEKDLCCFSTPCLQQTKKKVWKGQAAIFHALKLVFCVIFWGNWLMNLPEGRCYHTFLFNLDWIVFWRVRSVTS